MFIGVLECTGKVWGSTSLKDKRKVIQSVQNRLRNTFNLSVAEVDHQDNRTITNLACVGVNSNKGVLEQELHKAMKMIEETDGLVIMDMNVTYV